MRSVFVGYFRPTQDEFPELWSNGTFVVDANVLLNLYRYSNATRQELEKALLTIKDRAFIPHQAAKEFLRNRLSVTAGQAGEYSKTINALNSLLTTLSNKDRHPFLPDAELPKLQSYSEELIGILEEQQKSLLNKLSDDEILTFVENLFSGKTGLLYDTAKLDEIAIEGEDRYKREVPPGYKDSKKNSDNDQYRRFGDLIVWNQIIDFSKTNNKSVIFITDDKKEDWWLEQSGRTIGPRSELIEEFYENTKQKFWMYTVDQFIQESAKVAQTVVSDEVINEIIKISSDAQGIPDTQVAEIDDNPSIVVSQAVIEADKNQQTGFLIVTLNKSMKYATGTGRFLQRFSDVPKLEVELQSSPYDDPSNVGISFGCGTIKNFNIHIRAKESILKAGEYVFKFKAYIPQSE